MSASASSSGATARIDAPHARLVYLLGRRRGTTYNLVGERLHVAFGPEPRAGQAPGPGDDLILSDRADEVDRLATIVHLGGDRYEVHPIRPWVEIVLNGTQRVERPTPLTHRDTITIGGVAFQFHRLAGLDGDESSVVSPEEVSGLRADVAPTAEGEAEAAAQEILAATEGGADTSGLLGRIKSPEHLGRVALLTSRLGTLVGGVEAASEGLALRAIFQRFLAAIIEQIPGARGVILFYDKNRQTFRRVASVPAGKEGTRISGGAIRVVCRERSGIISRDTLAGPDGEPSGEKRAVLCVPILGESRVYGIIHLETERKGGFSEDDLNLIVGIAPLALIALRNATAIEALRSRDRLDLERLLTRAVLTNLASGAQPELVTGLEVAIRASEAEEPGGDLYDVVPSGDGRGAFVFLGTSPLRGVMLALFLSSARSVLRELCETRTSPREVLLRLCRRSERDSLRRVTLAGSLLYWDQERHQLAFAGIGDAPLVVRQAHRGRAERLPDAPPEGDENVSADRGFTLAPGDIVLVPSEGARRALAPDGLAEVTSTVDRMATAPIDELADALGAILARRGALSADATIVVARRPLG